VLQHSGSTLVVRILASDLAVATWAVSLLCFAVHQSHDRELLLEDDLEYS